MSGRLLSGAELFSSLQPVDIGLPQRGGQKHYCPEDTWLQEKQLDLFRRERRDVLQEERIAKDGSLNKGNWNPDVEKVELLKEKGKVWEHIGHVQQGKKWLHPEEAMFLVDQGQLELRYGDVSLTVKEAHSTLLAGRIPLLHYQVYAHLSRAGYILRRHDKNLITTGYEKKLKMDQHKGGSRKDRRRRKSAMKDESSQNDDVNSEDVKVAKLEESVDKDKTDKLEESVDEDKMAKKGNETNGSIESWISKDSFISSASDETLPDQGKASHTLTIGYSKWNFDEINFPSYDGKSGEVVVVKPAENHVPTGAAWPVNVAERHLLKFPIAKVDAPESFTDALNFSHGGSAWKRVSKARNWKEFKQEQQERQVGFTPASHLWEDSVTPLVKPQDSFSTGHILEKIKVTQNVHVSAGSLQQSANVNEADDNPIIYDIYLPNKKFRKSDPGTPHFRTCIVNAKDDFPSPARLFGAMRKCVDGVALLWAIVDNGDIAFYSFHDVDIPPDTVMG